jgi:hypothetical protein
MHSTNKLNDGYLGSGTRLRYAIRKYGSENFKIEILEWCQNREELAQREKEIITEEHLKNENCYNLKYGGIGGGKFFSSEHQFKCSQAAGLKHGQRMQKDEEYRLNYSDKISQANRKRYERGDIKSIQEIYDWTGKKHKQDTIEKMKKIKKGHGLGEKNSQYGTKWITNGINNKKIKDGEKLPEGWKYGYIKKLPYQK